MRKVLNKLTQSCTKPMPEVETPLPGCQLKHKATESNKKKKPKWKKGLFRKTHSIVNESKSKNTNKTHKTNNKQQDVPHISIQDYYGHNECILSPFSEVLGHEHKMSILYCDWTASGKNLVSVEKFINNKVLNYYANTHTQTSVTGKQTTLYRDEARKMILESDSVKGDPSKDVLLFCGNGVTGAIYKLANILLNPSLRPCDQNQGSICTGGTASAVRADTKAVVFVGIYEHNSNIYIWKELGAKVVVIPEYEDNAGKYGINLEILEENLIEYSKDSNYNLLIGSFSAASNVSGIIEKHDAITELLHKYQALSFWDFATAGPYVNINMADKDAVFLSPHKFLGGPGSPGILICKRSLCCNEKPVVAGGGTVFYAFGIDDNNSKYKEYKYHTHIEEREEGGTPDIIGSIRAALAFRVKDSVGMKKIHSIETSYVQRFLSRLKEEICVSKTLYIIGNTECPRLPIFSFLVRYKNKFLHYNFVAALLNDLFGIQGRGGCSCAGMYGYYELKKKFDLDIEHVLSQMNENANELARPGYFRINLHYTMTLEEVDYVIDCIKFVCQHGWKLMPFYDIDVASGLFVHRNDQKSRFHTLKDFNLQSENPVSGDTDIRACDTSTAKLSKCLETAKYLCQNLKQFLPTEEQTLNQTILGDNIELRGYWIPSDLYRQIFHSILALLPRKRD